MFKERLDMAMSAESNLYDAVISVKRYFGIHGFEYIEICNNIVDTPLSEISYYIDTISYSNIAYYMVL